MKTRCSKLVLLLLGCFCLLLLSCNSGSSDENVPMIAFGLRGHSQIVSPYLVAIKASENPAAFDVEVAKARIMKELPLPSPPKRGEFESKEEFQARESGYVKRCQRLEAKRIQKLKTLKDAHLRGQRDAARMNLEANKLKSESYKQLKIVCPTTAPRFDFDKKEFGPLSMPQSRLGMTESGYIAHMITNFKPKRIVVPDIEDAKKIREVSDAGNLLAIMQLTNARVKIESGTEEVKRSDLDKLGQYITQGLPELILRGLGEYVNPGINAQNPHPLTKYDIKRSDTVPAFYVMISADDVQLTGLVDGKNQSYILYRPKDNRHVEFYLNGQKKDESHWKNNKKDGLETWWHENGQKSLEAHWKNGEKDGLFTEWDEYGQKLVEVHFKNGKLDGLWTLWHENGQKKEESHWKNGKEHGLNTTWYKNGQKKAEIIWMGGEIVSHKEF